MGKGRGSRIGLVGEGRGQNREARGLERPRRRGWACGSRKGWEWRMAWREAGI